MAKTGEGDARRGERDAPRGLLGALEDPVSALRRMSDEVERLFHDFMGGRPGPTRAQGEGPAGWTPRVEVSQRGEELVISVDLPGTRREDVQVDIDERAIVVCGERRQASGRAEGGVLRSECSYGRFYRAVPLPEGANGDAARAVMRDGVLEVILPMPPRKQPRRLQVEGEDNAARKEAYRDQNESTDPAAATEPAAEHDRRGERRDWQGEGRLGM